MPFLPIKIENIYSSLQMKYGPNLGNDICASHPIIDTWSIRKDLFDHFHSYFSKMKQNIVNSDLKGKGLFAGTGSGSISIGCWFDKK